MFPEWTFIVGLFIGATIGSFLNVVIWRMPRGQSLSDPKFSYCPNCKHRLLVPDLVPLLSWIFLRGRCRHCQVPIPARYFFVELVNGAIWAALWWQFLIVTWDPAFAVAGMLFSAALVAAIYIDLKHFIIPDQVNAFMLVVGLGLNAVWWATGDERAWLWGMPSSIAGALVGVGILWGIAFLGRLLFGKDAMGHGDIKMARGIGAVLLPAGAGLSFGVAVVLGAVLGAVQVVARSRSEIKVLPGASTGTAPEGKPGQQTEEGGEAELPPESVGSLLRCGLGYLLAVDVVGLFWPKLYEWWFEENPYAVEELDEEPEVSLTMIPFGPYLAAGALAVLIFGGVLFGWVDSYWSYATGIDSSATEP